MSLIYGNYIKYGLYGLAEVYVRVHELGYTRSFGSMCRQIRLGNVKPVKKQKKSYVKYDRVDGKHIGDKVQVDIKYVPQECINFSCYGKKYYQITAIDEYSRKRILAIVEDKSTYETGKFLLELDKLFGFPIKTIQADNGTEFVNDREGTDKKSFFEEVAELKGYTIRRIRPCSPWQNGKVERSHREDGKIVYANKEHQERYNNIAKICLNFKSPNDVVEENKKMIGLH